MPRFGPISHREAVRTLERAGFERRRSGGKHVIMLRGGVTVVVPNPRGSDMSTGLLARLVRQAGLSREEWESL